MSTLVAPGCLVLDLIGEILEDLYFLSIHFIYPSGIQATPLKLYLVVVKYIVQKTATSAPVINVKVEQNR